MVVGGGGGACVVGGGGGGVVVEVGGGGGLLSLVFDRKAAGKFENIRCWGSGRDDQGSSWLCR